MDLPGVDTGLAGRDGAGAGTMPAITGAGTCVPDTGDGVPVPGAARARACGSLSRGRGLVAGCRGPDRRGLRPGSRRRCRAAAGRIWPGRPGIAALPGTRGRDGRATSCDLGVLRLGELALASGDPSRAVALAKQASDHFATLGIRPGELQALTILSHASAALGDLAAADAAAKRAAGHTDAEPGSEP
jgi:hypothetical protein